MDTTPIGTTAMDTTPIGTTAMDTTPAGTTVMDRHYSHGHYPTGTIGTQVLQVQTLPLACRHFNSQAYPCKCYTTTPMAITQTLPSF